MAKMAPTMIVYHLQNHQRSSESLRRSDRHPEPLSVVGFRSTRMGRRRSAQPMFNSGLSAVVAVISHAILHTPAL